jgi:DNA-binding transcriptional ArsR family regulator
MASKLPLREVTDARTMRALAHPIRIRLLEVLAHAVELTATEAGELVGESPASCSFHLRQLAKYGFVEEAPRSGGGRRRPWRRTGTGMTFSDVHDDPETREAAIALSRVLRDRNLANAQRGLEESLAQPPEWRRVLGMSDYTLYVTPDELWDIQVEILAIWRRYLERIEDPAKRPGNSKPIQMLAVSYPHRPGEA